MATYKSLGEFQARVEFCRRHKLPDILVNASTDYAAVLLENLFAFAKDEHESEIRILSGCLFSVVYDKLVGKVTDALNAGCPVRVITLCPSAEVEHTPFYKAVRDHARGSVMSLGLDINSERHFITVGDSAYRLETDDRASTAIASFNDKNGVVPQLKSKFEGLWRQRGGTNGVSGSIHGRP